MSKSISITARAHAFFWTGVFILFIGFVWLFNAVLTPFVLGLAIAYLLDPVVDRLEKHRFPRWLGALFILLLFYAVVAALLVLISPLLYREAQQFVEAAPEMFDKIWAFASPHLLWVQQHIGNGDMESVKAMIMNNAGKALGIGGGVLAGIGGGGKAVAGFFGTLAITPLVAFFMMNEWPRLTAWFDDLLPLGSRDTIHDLLHKIDRKIAGFIRGQISVACALALFYGVGLALTGVKFGFMIGLSAGLLYIIPYFGTAFGLIAGLASAFFQGISLALAGKIIAVFVAGQIVETYFLTPRLVGGSVGLHPVWILFAVMAGGSLFGVTGMLLAVPVAAIAGVLISFAIARYKASPYYRDGNK